MDMLRFIPFGEQDAAGHYSWYRAQIEGGRYTISVRYNAIYPNEVDRAVVNSAPLGPEGYGPSESLGPCRDLDAAMQAAQEHYNRGSP
jgi:hypothetical protein